MKTEIAVQSFVLLLIVWVLAFGRVLPANSCVWLEKGGDSATVFDETAVIVWDKKNQTQHLIRNATLGAEGASVGLIVPTPAIPQLANADAEVFSTLQQATMKRKIVYREVPYYGLVSWFLWPGPMKNTFTKAGSDLDKTTLSVDVISTQRVGNYDATILRASDAGALNRWLQKHGYNSNAAFEKWLRAYVEKGWIITAFKIAKANAEESTLSSRLVRMSFKTPRPFFPIASRNPIEARPK